MDAQYVMDYDSSYDAAVAYDTDEEQALNDFITIIVDD